MSGLTGTGALVRLGWRRDRILIVVSALALTALSVGSAQATVGLYDNPSTAMSELGPVLTSPTSLAMFGPATATSMEGLSIFKTLMMGAAILGLIAATIVRRHTRAEEEDGRLELLISGVVGRQAPLTAAVILATVTTAVTSLLSSVGLAAIGFPTSGSLAFAAAWAIAGLTMTGVAAVASQLTTSARGAAGWTVVVFAVMYAVRAVGDTATTGAGRNLSWLSPLGWVSQVFPYGRDRSGLLLAAVALGGVLVALAFALLERRDLGSGILHGRDGRARAGAALRSAPGLGWRLSRATVAGWVVGAAVMGSVYGGLVSQVDTMLQDAKVREMLAAMTGTTLDQLARSLADVYGATIIRFGAIAAAAAGIGLVLRLATEERTTRAEPVLASATSRTTWYLTWTGLAILLAAGVLLALCVVMGLRGHASFAPAPTASQMLSSGLEALPAALTLVGATALLAGLGHRAAPWAWSLLGATAAIGELGPTVGLPERVVDLSPFAQITAYPLATWDWAQTGWLLAVAVALLVAGLVAYRRRDVA